MTIQCGKIYNPPTPGAPPAQEYELQDVINAVLDADFNLRKVGMRPNLVVYLGTHIFQKLTSCHVLSTGQMVLTYGDGTICGYPFYEVRPRRTKSGFEHHGIEVFNRSA